MKERIKDDTRAQFTAAYHSVLGVVNRKQMSSFAYARVIKLLFMVAHEGIGALPYRLRDIIPQPERTNALNGSVEEFDKFLQGLALRRDLQDRLVLCLKRESPDFPAIRTLEALVMTARFKLIQRPDMGETMLYHLEAALDRQGLWLGMSKEMMYRVFAHPPLR